MDILFSKKLFLFSGKPRELIEFLDQACLKYQTVQELINANLH